MAKIKIFLLTVLCIFIAESLSACDVCGCSTGNYFIGPFPQFNKHFVGMRYSFRSFNTVLNSDNTQFSKDYYQTTELLLGTQIGRKWQLLMFVPFNVNRSVSDDGIKQNNGLSDITLMGNYNLFNKIKLAGDTEAVQHQLWIGGGIKLPTGYFLPDTSDLIPSANSQPGTGSFDFLLISSYALKIKNWGFTSNATYKINQAASHFKFGNRFAATAFISRSFHYKAITFNPNVGLLYENLGVNTLNNEEIDGSGGSALLSAVGIEMRIKSIAIGGNIQLPLITNLSEGQTNIKSRGMIQLSYVF